MAKKTTPTASDIQPEAPAVDLSLIMAAAQNEAAPAEDVQGTVVAATVDPQNKGELSSFPPNSVALESLLAAGYGMDKAQAEKIIAERAQNPALWPYEVYKKAMAFLEALSSRPAVVATNPGWKRTA